MTDTPHTPPPVLPSNAPTIAGSPWLVDEPGPEPMPQADDEQTP